MKKVIFPSLSVLALLAVSTPSYAAGFYLQEQSSSGQGAAFAGQAAMPRDASIIYYNPAGMTKLDGRQMNVGANLIAPISDPDDLGSSIGGVPTPGETQNPYITSVVPNFHFATPLSDENDIWAGISVTFPFGLSNKYDSDWFGRYDSIKSELRTVNVQPSVAYKLNDSLSLGAGLDVQYIKADLTQAVAVGGTEGFGRFDGDDVSVGWNAGLLWDATERLDLGLHYRSQMNHELDLSSRVVSGVGTPVIDDNGGTADLDLPDMATLAATYELNEQWTLLAHAIWFGWSNFDNLRAVGSDGTVYQDIEQNYQNTYAFAIGAEYEYSPEWTFRGGFQYDETPTQNEFRSTRTPDGDRMWFSAGATYNINDRLSIDAAATYIDVDTSEVHVDRPQALDGRTASIDGKYDQSVVIGTVGLNYKF